MGDLINEDRLIVPVHINEKIVLDMLAILEGGFSTVSQVNYIEHKESNLTQRQIQEFQHLQLFLANF